MTDLISENIQQNGHLVLDGAMATELEKRGIATNTTLWSATALRDNPQAIIDVHTSYFKAGADVAITNSYQANVPAFEAAGYTTDEAEEMITASATLAIKARQAYYDGLSNNDRLRRAAHPLVIGSIGPYGAYLADGSEYTGKYDLSQTAFKDFHRRRMQLLDAAGVDGFAFETQPKFAEVQALVDLLQTEFPTQHAWISFSINDNGRELWDGTPLSEAVQAFNDVDQISAIGINCTAMENIADAVALIKEYTDKPIIIYPNNGDIYDPATKTWQENEHATSFTNLVPLWQANGAAIIGGCCRTTPADIAEITSVLTDN